MNKKWFAIHACIIALVVLSIFITHQNLGALEAASIFFVLLGIVITSLAIRGIKRGVVGYKDGANRPISRELYPVGFWVYSSWDLMVGLGVIAATLINYYAKQ